VRDIVDRTEESEVIGEWLIFEKEWEDLRRMYVRLEPLQRDKVRSYMLSLLDDAEAKPKAVPRKKFTNEEKW
jgi:hypothetical protein